MHDVARPQTIDELLQALRDAGKVPLGIVSFDIDKEEFFIQMCPDVSPEELNALFGKLHIRFQVTT